MKCKVLLFGIIRETAGSKYATAELQEDATVKDLLKFFEEKYPSINDLSSIMVAVNNEYANGDKKLNENDEIALIPPVSGG